MTCPACNDGAQPHRDLPVLTQYASADLIEEFATGRRSLESDPRWAEFGSPTVADYAFWANRACGPTCLSMVLQHLGRPVPPLFDLAVACAGVGAFAVQGEDVGGIYYAPFVDYIQQVHQLTAEVAAELSMTDLAAELSAGRFVLASVNSSIRYVDRQPPRRGGHLVLAYGFDENGIHFNNPSGHQPSARQMVLPAAAFEPFYAGRGILIG